MQYKIKFVYLDGKDLDLNISAEKIGAFFEKLNRGEIYWHDEEQMSGFWLNLDKVRYIQFFGMNGEPVTKVDLDEQREDDSGESQLPCEVVSDSDREGDAEPA